MANDVDLAAENVQGEIDIFSDFEFDTVKEKINEAKLKVDKDKVDDSMKRVATLYYARHLLYIDYFMSSGGVTGATTLGQSFTNADMHNNDPYLQHYNQIVNDYGYDSSLGSVVAE